MIDNPRNVQSYDDRLSALEDPSLAERLLADNPELFGIRPSGSPERSPASAPTWQRFRPLGIVLAAIASIVVGYILFPLLLKRPAPQPPVRQTVAGAPPKPTGQHEKALKPIGTAPHEDATLRAELAKQQREIAQLRANLAAQAAAQREARARAAAAAGIEAARPAPVVVARPAVHAAAQPVQKYSSKPVWDVSPASKAHASTSTSVSTSTSTSTSTSVATSTATGTAGQTAADTADASTTSQMIDAPIPDGTKGAPPSGAMGHWNEHPYGVGGGSGSCSPSRDSMATGAGSVLSRAAAGRF